MNGRCRGLLVGCGLLVMATVASSPAAAYVQWAYMNSAGSVVTVKWTNPTVAWYVDGGGSGVAGVDAVAMTTAAFAAWNDLATSEINFTVAGSTSGDIRSQNIREIADPFLGTALDADLNINEVIFDADSSILRDFYGGTPFLLGVGMPQSNAAGAITTANMVVFSTNLDLSRQSGLDDLVYVLAHEAGHTAGFGHSPTAPDNPSADLAHVPLMYPFIGETLALSPDDIAVATAAYPSASATATFGRVSGTVHDSAAFSIFGALVELFDVADLTRPVIGTLSGAGLGPGHGSYTIEAVPPGTYYARIEAVGVNFEPVRIGGLYESVATSVTPEIYLQQTAFASGTPIVVTAGNTVSGVNFGVFGLPSTARSRPVESFPNPFLPHQGGSITMRIQPVTELSQMRVMTVDGRIIYRAGFDDQRPEATWNGRNASGELVGSGIYLVELQDIFGKWARGRFMLVR